MLTRPAQPKRNFLSTDSGEVVLCCRVDNQGNERLAGAEDKDDKKDPRCKALPFFLLMKMGVFRLMAMNMVVFLAVDVEMEVFMRFVLYRPVNSPDKIGKAEADKKPGCCSASK